MKRRSRWRPDHLPEAKKLFAEGLRLAADYGAPGWFGWMIGGVDWLARKEGRARRAARLWASAVRQVHPEHTAAGAGVAATLGLLDEVAEAAWKIGHEMSAEEAVTYLVTGKD